MRTHDVPQVPCPNRRTTETINVGIVGFGWMGQVHAKAMTRVRQHYPDLACARSWLGSLTPPTTAGWSTPPPCSASPVTTTDWRELVAREDIDLICVAGPNFTHRDVAVAAAEPASTCGSRSRPVATSYETQEIAAAVADAGVCSAVGFNYRNAPAVELARDLVASGRIGEVRHVRVSCWATTVRTRMAP